MTWGRAPVPCEHPSPLCTRLQSCPSRHVKTCSTLDFYRVLAPPYSDMFKPVYYELHMGFKRAVGVLLECFLVKTHYEKAMTYFHEISILSYQKGQNISNYPRKNKNRQIVCSNFFSFKKQENTSISISRQKRRNCSVTVASLVSWHLIALQNNMSQKMKARFSKVILDAEEKYA